MWVVAVGRLRLLPPSLTPAATATLSTPATATLSTPATAPRTMCVESTLGTPDMKLEDDLFYLGQVG